MKRQSQSPTPPRTDPQGPVPGGGVNPRPGKQLQSEDEIFRDPFADFTPSGR